MLVNRLAEKAVVLNSWFQQPQPDRSGAQGRKRRFDTHTNRKWLVSIDAPLLKVMVSLWVSRPEWICQVLPPSEVKVAPCAVVPKPEKIRVWPSA